jgi:hypothetical protein
MHRGAQYTPHVGLVKLGIVTAPVTVRSRWLCIQ